jgi:hypothetical protein
MLKTQSGPRLCRKDRTPKICHRPLKQARKWSDTIYQWTQPPPAQAGRDPRQGRAHPLRVLKSPPMWEYGTSLSGSVLRSLFSIRSRTERSKHIRLALVVLGRGHSFPCKRHGLTACLWLSVSQAEPKATGWMVFARIGLAQANHLHALRPSSIIR